MLSKKESNGKHRGGARQRRELGKRPTADRHSDSGKGKEGGGSRKKALPSCLNSKYNEKHYVADCPMTCKAEAKKLLEAHKENMKNRKERFKGKNHSTLFSASFCHGAMEVLLLADCGGDDNIVPVSLFKDIAKADGNIRAVDLEVSERFGPIDKDGPKIECDSAVTTTVELRLKHGAKLVLRGVTWKIGSCEMNYASLGRPVLESIGIKTKDLLEAIADKNADTIDVRKAMGQQGVNPDGGAAGEKSIANALAQAERYHSQGDTEDDDLRESDVYQDLGEHPEEDLDVALTKLVTDSRMNGMSDQGCTKLQGLLKKFKRIFKIRLGKSNSASVPPMKLEPKENSKLVRVRARRYSAEERAWLDKYVGALVKMGFLISNPDAAWQAAPILVPKKNSKAKYRMAIDLRPVKSANVKQAWPMPHLDSEVYDFADSDFFAVLDFVSGYWQCPVDKESWDACGIVTPKGTYSSTRVLPGLTNATTHFQSTVEALFKKLRENLKAWVDEFNLHEKTEDKLLILLAAFSRNVRRRTCTYLHGSANFLPRR